MAVRLSELLFTIHPAHGQYHAALTICALNHVDLGPDVMHGLCGVLWGWWMQERPKYGETLIIGTPLSQSQTKKKRCVGAPESLQ